jgi:UDP-N-acetylglucosamine--N-acetylmuramyl-(pentapeptide) pyrophosphoryl-undecaprenol N-acetylglucosamine transferase
VYPALTVLHALREIATEPTEILWVGGEGGMEADLVQRAGIPFESMPAAGVHGVGIRSMPGNLLKLARGFFKSKQILKRFRPDVLLFTGGYVAVPMALAGVPFSSLLFVPDIEPGLALKVISWFSDRITVPVAESFAHFPRRLHRRISVTGYPTRPELEAIDKASARTRLGLREGQPVLLVTGGSKGAQTINRAITRLLPELLPQWQVVHICGNLNWDETRAARQNLSSDLQENYHIYPYLHDEMGAALCAADLILSRAGASTLGEYPAAGTPAILVPYPYAWRYQKVNADYLVNKGAATLLPDGQMDEKLGEFITYLFEHPAKLEEMHQRMAALTQPHSAETIARELLDLASKSVKDAGGREEII